MFTDHTWHLKALRQKWSSRDADVLRDNLSNMCEVNYCKIDRLTFVSKQWNTWKLTIVLKYVNWRLFRYQKHFISNSGKDKQTNYKLNEIWKVHRQNNNPQLKH